MGSNFHYVTYPVNQKLEYNFVAIIKKKLTTKEIEDKNILNGDGIYDELINSKRTEVKTATRGTSNESWQHENIYSTPDLWDKLVFIDIDLNDIYITVINIRFANI